METRKWSLNFHDKPKKLKSYILLLFYVLHRIKIKQSHDIQFLAGYLTLEKLLTAFMRSIHR